MIINSNLPALNALNNLKKKNKKAKESMERLSSGSRINSAADDAAGLAIAQKMKSQIGGLNQAQRNIEDGISLLQTAEAGGKEIQSILQRMRELSVQAANDTLTNKEREHISKEINSLKNEVDNIAENTEFNNIKLLEGSQAEIKEKTFTAPYIGEFEITSNPSSEGMLGISNDDTMTHAQFEFVKPSDKDGTWLEVDIGNTREESLANLKDKFYAVKSGSEGSASNQSAIANMDMHIVGNKVVITSEDPFTMTHDPSKGIEGKQYLSGSPAELTVEYDNPNGGINLQTGPNSGNDLGINIPSITTSALDLNQIDVTDHSSASSSIDKVDNAIAKVSEVRTDLGSYQNRLEHSLNNTTNYNQNLTAAKSRILDADMAKETMKKTKSDILMNAARSVLSQANTMPSNVLSLIE
ncbi:flagellin [Halanaerocella petrolearia]